MGRRTSLASLAAVKVEDVPGHSAATLIRLRPDQIAATPLNPRHSFGTAEELADLGESIRVRQLQPVVVVARDPYLKLWPEHEEHLGDASYVLVNGERRYRAALQVSVERLDALHREEVADSRASFLDALLTENLDRKNFDPIEEAHAVEAMVAECGSATAAAEQFRRHKTWVSQRRALLKLSPELQEKVRSGDLPVRIARSIAALPHEEQESAWRAARDQEAAAREQAESDRRPTPPAAKVPDPRSADAGAASDEPLVPSPTDESSSPAPSRRGMPEPAANGQATAAVPWHSPEDLAALIRRQLPPEQVTVLVDLLRTDRVPQ